jgi:hypothetical protein
VRDAVHIDRLAEAKVLWLTELKLDPATVHIGADQAGKGLKCHVRAGNPQDLGEPGNAASPIAAHLGLAAVGVEDPHPELCLGGWLDQDQAVGAHRQPTPAETLCKHLGFDVKPAIAIVDHDEIISAAAHFVEAQFLHGVSFPSLPRILLRGHFQRPVSEVR